MGLNSWPWQRGPWFGFNWRYDSRLVAGLVPCAGGNCNNGPAGSASVVDTSIISPDQQFQAGLFCGPVHATQTVPDGLVWQRGGTVVRLSSL